MEQDETPRIYFATQTEGIRGYWLGTNQSRIVAHISDPVLGVAHDTVSKKLYYTTSRPCCGMYRYMTTSYDSKGAEMLLSTGRCKFFIKPPIQRVDRLKCSQGLIYG